VIDVQLPTAGPAYDEGVMNRAFDAIRTALRNRLVPTSAAPYVHLSAPNGSVWKVTVANDGTLTTTLAKGVGP
jgi:hypothetical protein